MPADLGAAGDFLGPAQPDLELGPRGRKQPQRGSSAIAAAEPNAPACLQKSAACNGGCDPTNVPGYSVTTSSNLLGSVTRNQFVETPSGTSELFVAFGITETALSDDAAGDPTNLIYLQEQCGAIVGNGTGGGICNCPTEG